MITKGKAINSLMPTAEFAVRGDVIEWINPTTAPLTDAQINAEVIRLQAEYDAKDYQRKRKLEYPPITDYLDGVAKGDQTQIDKYIADCQAVKAKYPKGA
jgi:hypothetical protein